MSWDASLVDDRGHIEGEWNYTHNCNKMANTIVHPDQDTDISAAHEILFRTQQWESWFALLDGMEGRKGAAFLTTIIDGLTADPERFQAMEPDNGWGSYFGFLEVLREMRDAVPDWPCSWRVSG